MNSLVGIGLLLLVLGYFTTNVYGRKLDRVPCELLSPYDAICTSLNNTVFILSAKPCYSKRSVTLTIIRTGDKPFFYSNNTEKTIDDPIRIGDSKYAVILDLHDHALTTDISIKLHATIYWTELDKNGTQISGYRSHAVLDVYFNMKPLVCEMYKNGDEKKPKDRPSFKKQEYCDQSKRLGDFSTLCYKASRGIFLTVLNVCDIPYSTTVVIMEPHNGLKIIEKFTESQNTPIPIKFPGLLGGELGVKLSMHSHGASHEKQHIVLTQVSENSQGNKSVVLIDDEYFTTYGMICPLSSCIKINPNTHQCKEKIISGNGTTVNASMIVKLDICPGTVISADVTINVEGYPNVYNIVLQSSHHFNIKEHDRHMFSLGGEFDSPEDGYLPVDNGAISLYVKEDLSKNLIQIMILRHYPYFYDAFPILRDEFYLSRSTSCKVKHSGSSNKIVIPIVCVILVLLLLVFGVWWWKRRRSNPGLPYQIELGTDDDDDDERDY